MRFLAAKEMEWRTVLRRYVSASNLITSEPLPPGVPTLS